MAKHKMKQKVKVVRTQAIMTSLSSRKKVIAVVVAALISIIGVTYLVYSKAEDTTIVPVGITKTQYPYPANAIFVSPYGDNLNAGTLNSPLKTLQAAVDKAVPGSTIVMRSDYSNGKPGIYREALKTLAKQLIIQPYPNEEVWLDGTDIVTGWMVDGNSWRRDNWTAAATVCPNDACADPTSVTSENPAGGLPDMTFVDGVELKQLMKSQVTNSSGVVDTSKIVAGTFYVDRAGLKMYIGTNPSGKTVESATRKEAIFYYSAATAGSKLRGIGIRRYAANINFASKPALIEVTNGAKNIEFENNTFTQSSASGLFVSGTSADISTGNVIKNNTFALNGGSGLSGNYVGSLVMENNNVYKNNTEKAQYEGEYGAYAGTKLARATNSTIKNNLFQDNYGTGFWCDLDCRGNSIIGNMARGNLNHGIYYEVSYDAIIASNVSYNNGVSGFKINGRNIKVYNNTAYNNAADNLFIYDDPRLPSQNIIVKNNISAGGPKSTAGTRLINDRLNMSIVGNVVTEQNYNLYFRPIATQPTYVLGWQGTNINANYANLDSTLKSQTGREANSSSVDGKDINTLFKAAAVGDFKLVAGAAAVNTGTALPADVATAIGVPAGVTVNQGAITWKAGSSSALNSSNPDATTPTPVITNKLPTANVGISNTSFSSPADYTVFATGSDSDGTITKLEVIQNNNIVLTCPNVIKCELNAKAVSAGTYSYMVKAYDNATPAGVAVSTVQTVTVANTPVIPVTVSSPASISTRVQLNNSTLKYDMYVDWSPVAGATSYQITQYGQNPRTSTSNMFVNPNVSTGYTYQYEVAALNGSIKSTSKVTKSQLSCFLIWCWNSPVN